MDSKSKLTNAKSQGQTWALWETGPWTPGARAHGLGPWRKETGAQAIPVASGAGMAIQPPCSDLFFSFPLFSSFPSFPLPGRRHIMQGAAQIATRKGKSFGVGVG